MEVITWTILVLISVVSFFFLTSKHMRSTKGKRLPPGPIGFPVLGSLHLLGKSPHRDLHKLAQKYGPIMHLRLGQVPNIVASSPEAAELFLKTHDLVFASRPPLEASRLISYGQKNLVFGTYGPYWRNIRKLCTLELLSNHKVSSFRYIRKEEVDLLVQLIQEASTDRLSVDISAKVSSFVADMSCRMIFGKKYSDKDLGGEETTSFKAVMHEISQVAAVPNLSDFVPFASPFDLQGLRKRMTKVSEVVDGFLERIIDEHQSGDSDKRKSRDFVDVMLGILESESSDYQIDRDGIKALMLDMFAASVDTSGSAIEWTLSELLKHPIVMEKLRMELESKVGLNRTVDELDLENLEYLWMVVKETMRLHPVAPILIHASMEDFTVKDFFIPKDSRVLVNLWAIGRDPSVWVDPDKFMPERFKSSNIDVRGRDFQLTPFGAGRRSCPGMHLGLTVVGHVVAQLVHCFDWELPDGMVPSELDMAEEFGLVMSRAKHLVAVPRFRLLI